jgi:hypothetical protein
LRQKRSLYDQLCPNFGEEGYAVPLPAPPAIASIGMGDSGSGWWFGADRRWRKGEPPPGWHQGEDGTWRPPSGVDDGTDSGTDPPARHMAVAADRPSATPHGESSLLTRIVAPVSIVVVAVCAIVAIAAVAGIARVETGGSGGRADDVASLEPAPDHPATTDSTDLSSPPAPGPAVSGSTSTSTSSLSTTTSSTSTSTSTTEPPSTDTTAGLPPSDLFALCSEGQLAILDRGNRPWSWYVARLDEDGDGILCN